MKKKNNFTPDKNRVMWAPNTAMPPFFGLCLSEIAWKKFTKQFKIDGVEFQAAGKAATCSMLANGVTPEQTLIIITFAEGWEKRSLIEIYGLLVHECVHAFYQMCDHIGEEAPSSEFRSYFIQMLFQCFARQFEELMKKKGKK